MSDSARLRRQWNLLQMLSQRRFGMTVRELAQELETGDKTIRRDLTALKDVGFQLDEHVESHGRKRWRLHCENGQPQMSFNLDEVAALYLGRRFLEPLAGTVFWKGAHQAFQKILSALGDDALRHLEKIARADHPISMGPRSFNRGKSSDHHPRPLRGNRFNGAARSWGPPGLVFQLRQIYTL